MAMRIELTSYWLHFGSLVTAEFLATAARDEMGVTGGPSLRRRATARRRAAWPTKVARNLVADEPDGAEP